jgi:Helix-turn-helix domain
VGDSRPAEATAHPAENTPAPATRSLPLALHQSQHPRPRTRHRTRPRRTIKDDDETVSYRALHSVWELTDPRLKATHRAVLWALAGYANHKTGECRPRIPVLADKAGLSQRGVLAALRDLQDWELVAVAGGKRSRRYRVLPRPCAEPVENPAISAPRARMKGEGKGLKVHDVHLISAPRAHRTRKEPENLEAEINDLLTSLTPQSAHGRSRERRR